MPVLYSLGLSVQTLRNGSNRNKLERMFTKWSKITVDSSLVFYGPRFAVAPKRAEAAPELTQTITLAHIP